MQKSTYLLVILLSQQARLWNAPHKNESMFCKINLRLRRISFVNSLFECGNPGEVFAISLKQSAARESALVHGG